MKKLIFYILSLAFSTSIFSQQLKVVENLYKDENSRYAIDYPREDFNKTLCGLILVELDMPEATFEGDVVYSEFFMAKGADKSVSDWVNRLDNKIRRLLKWRNI